MLKINKKSNIRNYGNLIINKKISKKNQKFINLRDVKIVEKLKLIKRKHGLF